MIEIEKFITNEMINELNLEKSDKRVSLEHVERELKTKLYEKSLLKSEKKEITDLIENFILSYNDTLKSQKETMRDKLIKEFSDIQSSFLEKLDLLSLEFRISKDFSIFNKDFKFNYYNQGTDGSYTLNRPIGYDKFSMSFENDTITFICSKDNTKKISEISSRYDRKANYIEYRAPENSWFSKIAFDENDSSKSYQINKEKLLKFLILDNINKIEVFFKMTKILKDLHFKNFVDSKHKINIKHKIEAITKGKSFTIKSLETDVNDLLDIIALTEDLELNRVKITDIISDEKNKTVKP